MPPASKPAAKPAVMRKPPEAAVDALSDHPELGPEFDRKYGQGAAMSAIRGRGLHRLNEMTDDMAEIAQALADHDERFDSIEAKLDALIAFFRHRRELP